MCALALWQGEGWQDTLSQFGIGSAASALPPASLSVVDGDTLAYGAEQIRVANIDTPERGSRAECDIERRRALNAAAHARYLVETAVDIRIRRQGTDAYGRTLARVRLDGKDFGRQMIRDGHARHRTRRSRSWC